IVAFDAPFSAELEIGKLIIVNISSEWNPLLNITLKIVGKISVGPNTKRIINGSYAMIDLLDAEEIPSYSNASFIFCNWSSTMGPFLDSLLEKNIWVSQEPAQILIKIDRNILSQTQSDIIIEQLRKIWLLVVGSAQRELGRDVSWTWIIPILQEVMELKADDFNEMSKFVSSIVFPSIATSFVLLLATNSTQKDRRSKEAKILRTSGLTRAQINLHQRLEVIIASVSMGTVGIILGAFFVYIMQTCKLVTLPGASIFTQERSRSLIDIFQLSSNTIIISLLLIVIISLLSLWYPVQSHKRKSSSIGQQTHNTHSQKTKLGVVSLGFLILIGPVLGFSLGTVNEMYWVIGPLFAVFAAVPFGATVLLAPLGLLILVVGLCWIIVESVLFQRISILLSRSLLGEIGHLGIKGMLRKKENIIMPLFFLLISTAVPISVILQTGTQLDYTVRYAKASVGADVRLELENASKTQDIMALVNDIEGVEYVAEEYWFNAYIRGKDVQITAIDPFDWQEAAYFESLWFQSTLSEEPLILLEDNSIILNNPQWSSQFHEGDTLTIANDYPYPTNSTTATAIGFFGGTSTFIRDIQPEAQDRSFISITLLKQLTSLERCKAVLLVKADIDTQTNIRTALSGISGIKLISAQNTIDTMNQDIQTYFQLETRGISLIFAFFLAFIGIPLTVSSALFEDKEDIASLRNHGISNHATFRILFARIAVLLTMALPFGFMAGVLEFMRTTFGNLSSRTILVNPQFYLPPSYLLMILFFLLVIISNTIASIHYTIRKNRKQYHRNLEV
ncbi:MAG: hypothetical protein P1Q69_12545, partial [Candidatus Thorarchaeota archaeon]|nr:hypothetical protein [Candidatus Thorarchaeota archaeon]